MESYRNNSYSSHGFTKVELFVFILAFILVVLFAYPKARGMISKIKLDNAIDSAYSYLGGENPKNPKNSESSTEQASKN